MRKIRLRLDDLQVTSFAAGSDTGARGTVAAHRHHTLPFTFVADCTHGEQCQSGIDCQDNVPYSTPGTLC